MGEAVFSYRSLPHWGRGTAPAVDRVLSLIVDLRCIFSLSFIPLEPYPARYARHLPHAGKAGDTRETCHPQTFGHRPIYICGEAATTTLNPLPFTLYPLPFTLYPLLHLRFIYNLNQTCTAPILSFLHPSFRLQISTQEKTKIKGMSLRRTQNETQKNDGAGTGFYRFDRSSRLRRKQ